MTAASQESVMAAITAVSVADERRWLRHTAAALDDDAAQADELACAQLRQRLVALGVHAGQLPKIVELAARLAAGSARGPFRCPAFLFELAIRRALGEAGCVDAVDRAEIVRATVQTAGLLDLREAMTPPGWSTALWVHGPESTGSTTTST